MAKRKALGRGLSALIPEARDQGEGGGYFQCPVDEIEPNPYQPRKDFGESELESLASSVREKGVITPLLVTRTETGYQLIAGERRWRAAKRAGLQRIPVVVRETSPMESLELALIENIHRKDLNPVEEALAYKRWLDDGGTTQEDLAKVLGKDRSTITNMLRLLKLPRVIQEDLINGRLSMGHARVLAGLKTEMEQTRLRKIILEKALTVREAEQYAQRRPRGRSAAKPVSEQDHYLVSVAEQLKRSLGTKVDLRRRGRKGTITIYYYSDEELDRLLDRLT